MIRKGKFTKFRRENGVLVGKYYKALPKALMIYYWGTDYADNTVF